MTSTEFVAAQPEAPSLGSKGKSFTQRIKDLNTERVLKVARREFVSIESDRYIPISASDLVARYANTLTVEKDREDFVEFAAGVEIALQRKYAMEMEKLLYYYSYFDPQTGAKKLADKKITPEQADQLENNFLKYLVEFLDKSNYMQLGNEDIAIAESQTYLLNYPITMDVNRVDATMLTKFYSHHPQLAGERTRYSDHCLIFRRGVGIDKLTDRFINQKIDTILTWIWNYVFWTVSKIRWGKEGAPVTLPATITAGAGDASSPPAIIPAGEAFSPATITASAGQTVGVIPVDAESLHHTRVERIRLDNMELSLQNFLSLTTIQEPTFKRVLVAYRKATPPKAEKKKKKAKVDEPPPPPPTLAEQLGDRAIHIRHFNDIPMADMELVLPEKKNAGLSTTDMIKWLMVLITGFTAFLATIRLDDEKKIDQAILIAGMAAFLGYLSKVYATWNATIARYRNILTTTMYEKQIDSGRSTLIVLAHDAIRQITKEAVVAYYEIFTSGTSTLAQMDAKAESSIFSFFNVRMDFDASSAIATLAELQVVKEVGGQLTAVPPTEAVRVMETTMPPSMSEIKFSSNYPSPQ